MVLLLVVVGGIGQPWEEVVVVVERVSGSVGVGVVKGREEVAAVAAAAVVVVEGISTVEVGRGIEGEAERG